MDSIGQVDSIPHRIRIELTNFSQNQFGIKFKHFKLHILEIVRYQSYFWSDINSTIEVSKLDTNMLGAMDLHCDCVENVRETQKLRNYYFASFIPFKHLTDKNPPQRII